ncbi:ribosomal protein 63, mitochondrial-like [Argiope bruennichi]|uniref:ribosomal protein 63, mitochondrial-like n=1 Tax=Argiope bruennichi TaxID=94029 RepID=UPI0024951547|nr:ribosomal protein 63, mitochondrial-like [Argiope bruennichi]
MKLTTILFKYKFVKGIPGNIWIGKHRFVPPVTRKVRLEMWKKMMIEEEVMMYLKNPYVTEEQEKLYLEQNEKPQEKVFIEKTSTLKPLKERSVAYHLNRLNHNRPWGDHEYEPDLK